MKPQSSQSSTLSSDETRDSLCSPTEYRLMETTEDLQPVYRMVGYWYRAFCGVGRKEKESL